MSYILGKIRYFILAAVLEGAVRRGRGGKEKEWTYCVQSDMWAYGIAGDWKVTALEPEVCVKTVPEGGRRFMAARRKEGVQKTRLDIARRGERQRDWEIIKVFIAYGSVKFCEATLIVLGLYQFCY